MESKRKICFWTLEQSECFPDVGETSGTKYVSICATKNDVVINNSNEKENKQKLIEEIKSKKKIVNARYKKNLIAWKQFWKKKENKVNDKNVDSISENSNQKFVNSSRAFNQNVHSSSYPKTKSKFSPSSYYSKIGKINWKIKIHWGF